MRVARFLTVIPRHAERVPGSQSQSVVGHKRGWCNIWPFDGKPVAWICTLAVTERAYFDLATDDKTRHTGWRPNGNKTCLNEDDISFVKRCIFQLNYKKKKKMECGKTVKYRYASNYRTLRNPNTSFCFFFLSIN